MLEVRRKEPYLILGALGLGGFLSVEKSLEILVKASESGLTDIDCAISYGNGKAREIIGDFHKSGGIRFNIWEKIGLEMVELSPKVQKVRTRFSNPKSVRSDLNRILENYQVEKLYNLQLHSPLLDLSRKTFLQSLKLEQKKGTFGYLGVSNHETSELIKLNRDCESANIKISSNQVHFNIAEQRAKNDIIAH